MRHSTWVSPRAERIWLPGRWAGAGRVGSWLLLAVMVSSCWPVLTSLAWTWLHPTAAHHAPPPDPRPRTPLPLRWTRSHFAPAALGRTLTLPEPPTPPLPPTSQPPPPRPTPLHPPTHPPTPPTHPLHSWPQVDFPERPGALRDFLPTFSARWNVTLFHYRKSGSRSTGVLLGLQVCVGWGVGGGCGWVGVLESWA